MIIGRLLGFLFLIIAAIAFLRDALAWYDSGRLMVLSGEQLWFNLAPASLDAAQTWLRDNILVLWDPVMATLLRAPAFVLPGVIGAVLVFLSRPRARRRPRPA
jgi:hypothetical protein